VPTTVPEPDPTPAHMAHPTPAPSPPAPGRPAPAQAPAAAGTPPADGSADLLKRALPLMSKHADGYAPDSYALWYEYVRGGNAALREELDRLLKGGERLSRALTFELHQKHVADRSEETVRKASAGLLELMSSVRDSVSAATTDASSFDAQLAAFGEGLSNDTTPEMLREQVDSMRDDVGRMNRSLSSLNDQLEASRREVDLLHGELRRAREEASKDVLTGCVNRRGFDAELIRLCREAEAQGSTVSIVMFDIDHFKRINDAYGHPFGDQVIRAVGQVISALTQRKDVAARYGGEEFALLLPDTPKRDAAVVAERIRSAVRPTRRSATSRCRPASASSCRARTPAASSSGRTKHCTRPSRAAATA
jgi:diguanylate cyclase